VSSIPTGRVVVPGSTEVDRVCVDFSTVHDSPLFVIFSFFPGDRHFFPARRRSTLYQKKYQATRNVASSRRFFLLFFFACLSTEGGFHDAVKF
jgi:hypothetical protein